MLALATGECQLRGRQNPAKPGVLEKWGDFGGFQGPVVIMRCMGPHN